MTLLNSLINTKLQELLSNFMDVIPKLIAAIFVLIIGWIIAKVAAKIVLGVLKKINIDAVAEKLNEIDIVSKANIKLVPSTLVSKILYYLILLFTVLIATDILAMEAVSKLMNDLLAYIPSILSAALVLILGLLVSEFIKNIVLTTCQSLGIPSAKIIATVVFYFLFLTVLMSALAQAKINTEFITANLTLILGGIVLAFAFGYGFASRDLMANFLASFYSKEKFALGDVITIDGVKGEIIAINSTSIVLHTGESRVIVPLSKVTSQKVEIHQA